MRVMTIPEACLVKMYLGYLPMAKEWRISRGSFIIHEDFVQIWHTKLHQINYSDGTQGTAFKANRKT